MDRFDKLEAILAFEEGVRGVPYDDATGKAVEAPKGRLSIGIGHNLKDEPLSMAVIRLILNQDILQAIDDYGVVVGQSVTLHEPPDARWVALIAITFQLGMARFREFKDMISAIRAGLWKQAAAELLDSALAAQCPFRTRRMAHMIETGTFPEEYNL